MNTREFASKLNRTSKNVLKPLIPALGLHKRAEKVLYMRYVDEASIYDIADDLGIAYESLSNYLCIAREEMLKTIEKDYDILPSETQLLINKLLQ